MVYPKGINITNLKKIYQSSGILVLDAHISPLDIFITVRYLRKQFPGAQIMMPTAGYVPYVPLLKQIISIWSRKNNITVYQVFRKEEESPVNLLMKIFVNFYPKSLTREKKRAMNHAYLDAGIKALNTPNNFVVVAPYGSPLWFGKKIKNGVTKLLKSSKFWVVAGTKIRLLRFKTQLSGVVETNTDMDIEKIILQRFGGIGYYK